MLLSRHLLFLNLVALLAVLKFAQEPLLPLAIAAVLTLLLGPFVTRLTRMGLPRPLSALLITLGFGAAVLVIVTNFMRPLERWALEMPRALAVLQQEGAGFGERLRRLSDTSAQVEAMAADMAGGKDEPVRVAVETGNATERAMELAVSSVYVSLIVLITLFFLLTLGPRMVRSALMIPRERERRRRWVRIVRGIQHGYTRYILTVTFMNIALAVFTGVALSLIGVPDAWLWGVMAGVLNYVPFFGTAVTTIAITTAALISQQEMLWMLLPGIVYLLVNGIEANIITPTLLGESLSLNPLVVLLAIVFMGWLWGVGGMFVAVPLLVVLKVAMAELEPNAHGVYRLL
mgnify:CR=1 FL=1